jgi:hypothetical protein
VVLVLLVVLVLGNVAVFDFLLQQAERTEPLVLRLTEQSEPPPSAWGHVHVQHVVWLKA